jgi:hypothetical protein
MHRNSSENQKIRQGNREKFCNYFAGSRNHEFSDFVHERFCHNNRKKCHNIILFLKLFKYFQTAQGQFGFLSNGFIHDSDGSDYFFTMLFRQRIVVCIIKTLICSIQLGMDRKRQRNQINDENFHGKREERNQNFRFQRFSCQFNDFHDDWQLSLLILYRVETLIQ